MPRIRVTFLLCFLGLVVVSCGSLSAGGPGIGAQGTPDVGQVVQATFQAMTAQAVAMPTTASTPTIAGVSSGSIAGTLTYPADSLPPLYVTAFEVGTQNYRFVITNAGQGTYQIDGLTPGAYHVVAYTVGGGGFPAGLAGGYTQAVPCGLSADCADHSLLDVKVAAGKTTLGINPGDWFPPSASFPPFPQQAGSPASPATLSPAITDGSIAGNLMYPAEGIPAMRVVAFRTENNSYYFVETSAGQSSYQLDHVPPGSYHVVAYTLAGGGIPGGLSGGYSQMVPCGFSAGCTDHTLLDVTVTAGSTTTGIDPNDFYANAGTFPPSPVP